MQIIIDKNVITQSQIKGFGDILSTFNLVVHVTDILNPQDTRDFILSLQITALGNAYTYNNIYSPEDIQPDGNLIIGEISVIGPVTLDDLVINAKFIYLDTHSF
ncbi:MAG: hypothetical protein ACRCWY_12665 [Cellulosilyticaceae bacterium]